MASDTKLGTPPSEGGVRDAVHVAVVAAQAATDLCVGDPVRIRDDGKAVYCDQRKSVGIVDPFLPKNPGRGDWFWLCLNPGSITSLRHVWEHPAFPLSAASKAQADRPDPSQKEASEQWIRRYVIRHCPHWAGAPDNGYENFLGYVRDERWIFYAGDDCHGLHDVEDADELFRHLSIVLDMRIDASYFEAFTCSC